MSDRRIDVEKVFSPSCLSLIVSRQIMKPKTPGLGNFRIGVFDVETDSTVNPPRFLYAHAATFNRKDHGARREQGFNTKRSLTEWLLREKPHLTYAHKASYDIQNGLDFERLQMMNLDYHFLSFMPIIFIIETYPWMRFYDSLAFAKKELGEIGTHFGLPKVKLEDYSGKDLARVVQRCVRDVEITEKLVQDWLDQCNAAGCQQVPVSISQFAFFLLRSSWKDNFTIDRINTKLARDSYYGDRTEAFTKNQSYAVSFDMNSAYGLGLADLLPTRLHQRYGVCSKRKLEDLLEACKKDARLVSARVHVNVPKMRYPWVPRRIKGRLFFPWGRFITSLCQPELEITMPFVEEAQAVEVYDAERFGESFVRSQYELRLAAARMGDKLHEDRQKDLITRAYGKFGQRAKELICVGKESRKIDSTAETFTFMDATRKATLIRYGRKLFVEKEGNAMNSVAVAAYITSYPRRMLVNYINTVTQNGNTCDLLYVATDQIIVTPEGAKQLTPYMSEKMGLLKKQWEGQFMPIRNKGYFFPGGYRISGVPRKNVTIVDGVAIFDRVLTPRETISAGLGIGQTATITVHKSLGGVDDKRAWDTDGWSMPANVDALEVNQP